VRWRIFGRVLPDRSEDAAPTLLLSSLGSLPCRSVGCRHTSSSLQQQIKTCERLSDNAKKLQKQSLIPGSSRGCTLSAEISMSCEEGDQGVQGFSNLGLHFDETLTYKPRGRCTSWEATGVERTRRRGTTFSREPTLHAHSIAFGNNSQRDAAMLNMAAGIACPSMLQGCTLLRVVESTRMLNQVRRWGWDERTRQG